MTQLLGPVTQTATGLLTGVGIQPPAPPAVLPTGVYSAGSLHFAGAHYCPPNRRRRKLCVRAKIPNYMIVAAVMDQQRRLQSQGRKA